MGGKVEGKSITDTRLGGKGCIRDRIKEWVREWQEIGTDLQRQRILVTRTFTEAERASSRAEA